MPIASYAASVEELRVVPGIGIASRGPVRTVVLVASAMEEMTAIALDGASRTSQMLARLLTRERGLDPDFVEVLTTGSQMRQAARAARSSSAISACTSTATSPCLRPGGEMAQLGGTSLVYAVWAGRPGVVSTEDVALLQESLRLGLQRRAEIGRAWAWDNDVDPAVGENYLLENIRHRLTSDEISGATASRAQPPGGLLAKPMRVRLLTPRPRPSRSRARPSHWIAC